MMDLDKRALDALAGATMRMASRGKRFRNDLLRRRAANPAYHLSDRQREYLFLLCWTYRRQIRDSDVLQLAGSYQGQRTAAHDSPTTERRGPQPGPASESPPVSGAQTSFWP